MCRRPAWLFEVTREVLREPRTACYDIPPFVWIMLFE